MTSRILLDRHSVFQYQLSLDLSVTISNNLTLYFSFIDEKSRNSEMPVSMPKLCFFHNLTLSLQMGPVDPKQSFTFKDKCLHKDMGGDTMLI